MAKTSTTQKPSNGFDINALTPKQLLELKEQAESKLQESLIERCKALKEEFNERCSEEGLTLSQVFFEGRQGGVASVKFKDPTTGKTWSGRGKKPQWLFGHEREYAVS